jgi:hypothetical protein
MHDTKVSSVFAWVGAIYKVNYVFFLKDFSLKQQSYPWSPLEANH